MLGVQERSLRARIVTVRFGSAAAKPRIRQDQQMEDDEFTSWLTKELASLPSVRAVSLGGSRARREHRPDSDWDFAIYYRGHFDPSSLRSKDWEGEVSDVGGWGGGVMNGGAWLSIDGRRVDVHYRDLDEVEHWCAEARQGRFRKELLLFYAAGIPTYVVMGELALNLVLSGELPVPEYPEALSLEAGRRWRADAIFSLGYGEAALHQRGDITVALANASRGLIEASHARLAERKEWVLNEKGITERAGIADQGNLLLAATSRTELLDAIGRILHLLQSESHRPTPSVP